MSNDNLKKKSIEIKEINDREIWVGENRIYMDDDNIIHLIVVGDLDEKLAVEIERVIIEFGDMVEGKVNSLIDLNKAGKHSPQARKIFKGCSEHEKAGKSALIGMHPVAKVLAAFFYQVSGKKDLCFFKTKEEASAWLKE